MRNRSFSVVALALFIALVPARAAGTGAAAPVADTAAAAPTAVRVACVGDSITFGSGLKNRQTESYPAVLGRILGPGYEVGNFGVSGATLLKHGNRPYWDQKRFAAADEFRPDVVVIKLGTNDSKTENWPAFGGEFDADAAALIEHFRQLPSHPKVWVCLPVPVTGPLGTINEPTTAIIREHLRAVATKAGVPVIDPSAPFTAQPERLHDGVHPDAAGAILLAGQVAASLVASE